MHNAPPIPPNLIPEDHDRLDKVYQYIYVRDPATLFQNDIHVALRDATLNIKDTTPKEYVKTLCQYWFESFKVRMQPDMPISKGALYDMDDVVTLMVEANLVDAFIEREDDRNMLVWTCLTLVAAQETGGFQMVSDVVEIAFKRWLDDENAQQVPLTLADAINRTYGAGVWELYAQDAETTVKIPSHLYRQNLKVVHPGNVATQATCEMTLTLPNSFE